MIQAMGTYVRVSAITGALPSYLWSWVLEVLAYRYGPYPHAILFK